jgi:hypothetical protein
MLYSKFIQLVEDHAEELTNKWINEIKTNPSTSGYKDLNDQVLGSRVYNVYRKLGEWLDGADLNDPKIAEHFIQLGRDRATEKLKSSEVIYALLLTRVVLWKYITNHSIISSSFELHQSLEFYQLLINFFDKATYFTAVGFESIHKEVQEKINKEDFVEKAVQGLTDWLIKKK